MDSGYSLEPPRLGEAVLMSIHNLCFEQKHEKNIIVFIWNVEVEFSIY